MDGEHQELPLACSIQAVGNWRKAGGEPLSCEPLKGWSLPTEMGKQQYSPLILSAFDPAELFAAAGKSGTSQVDRH